LDTSAGTATDAGTDGRARSAQHTMTQRDAFGSRGGPEGFAGRSGSEISAGRWGRFGASLPFSLRIPAGEKPAPAKRGWRPTSPPGQIHPGAGRGLVDPAGRNPTTEIRFNRPGVILQDLTQGRCPPRGSGDTAAMAPEACRLFGGDTHQDQSGHPGQLVHRPLGGPTCTASPERFSQERWKISFQRQTHERSRLRWGQGEAFKPVKVVPRGTAIVHQVHIEYLGGPGRGWTPWTAGWALKTETCVGTELDTPRCSNGLGRCLGGGASAGIEREAPCSGQALSIAHPEGARFRLTGRNAPEAPPPPTGAHPFTEMAAPKHGPWVGKFVEFTGARGSGPRFTVPTGPRIGKHWSPGRSRLYPAADFPDRPAPLGTT